MEEGVAPDGMMNDKNTGIFFFPKSRRSCNDVSKLDIFGDFIYHNAGV